MYLNRGKLAELSDDLIPETSNTEHPFEPDKQIRVCSIDIRVDSVFWITKGWRAPIDLGSNKIFEISPRRLWKKVVIDENLSIELKPGEMILGRTYEKICMPIEYVGKINTRSSYARLGLSTACNCDLINPGYEGHVPLELTNTTPNTFLIRPYLPLCQIFVMPLTGGADDSYNEPRYKSKYMDDEGGPSVWWRDDLVKKISSKTFPNQLTNTVVEDLRRRFESIDDDGLLRLEQLIEDRSFTNADELLQVFGTQERRRQRSYSIRVALTRLFSVGLFGTSILQLQKITDPNQAPDIVSYVIWTLLVISLPFALYDFIRGKKRFYSGDE